MTTSCLQEQCRYSDIPSVNIICRVWPIYFKFLQNQKLLIPRSSRWELYKTHQCVAVLEPYSVCRSNIANILLLNAKLNTNPSGWQNAKWKNKVKRVWVIQRIKTVLKWCFQWSFWWGNNDNILHFNTILHLSVSGCFTTCVIFSFRTCLFYFGFTNGEAMIHSFSLLFFFFLFAFRL